MKSLLRQWPPPPQMSRRQYLRYRLRLLALLLVWLVFAVAVVVYWDSLILPLKAILIVIGIVMVPDISSVEKIFVSYKRYLREGL